MVGECMRSSGLVKRPAIYAARRSDTLIIHTLIPWHRAFSYTYTAAVYIAPT